MNVAVPTTRSTRRKPRVQYLPEDRRQRQGGYLFLGALLIFFVSTVLLYAIYAYTRRDQPLANLMLPPSLWVSTLCLLLISGLVHRATRTIRRDRFVQTGRLLAVSCLAAVGFLVIQVGSMAHLLMNEGVFGRGRGIAAMIVVLAVLHALHVVGGVVALAVTGVKAYRGGYDHERHWPVDFAAHYWHFLDGVWLCMLAAFWATTGGF